MAKVPAPLHFFQSLKQAKQAHNARLRFFDNSTQSTGTYYSVPVIAYTQHISKQNNTWKHFQGASWEDAHLHGSSFISTAACFTHSISAGLTLTDSVNLSVSE